MSAEQESKGFALRPFTPRAVEVEYVSPPWHEVVFLGISTSVVSPCDTTYPYDARNLSILDFVEDYLQDFDNEFIVDFNGDPYELMDQFSE